jgi:acylglycerol lipase
MGHIEGCFKGVRNSDIYYQAWLPEGEIQAVLLIVHGLGEHCGRYMNLVNHFIPLGYAVYGFDHIGHGKSAGRREYVKRFEDFTNTLTTYDSMVRSWHTDTPVFLLGHSMGGLIATYYLLDHQVNFKGAVVSAPSINVSEGISQASIALGKILSIVAPRVGLLELDAKGISRDPEVVAAYLKDPLVFKGKTPARLAAELLKAIMRVAAELYKITLPFVVVQGSADRIVRPDAAQMLYDKAGSEDKTIQIYEGLYHEVFNEPEHANVLKDVENWIRAHT